MAETFGFAENLSTGPPGQMAKYRPDPGEVVVEVYSANGELLNLDSFNAGLGAPRNSCYVSENMFEQPYDRENGIAATFTSLNDAERKAILEWEGPFDMSLPFEVPQYIIDKPRAHSMKLWWGSKGPDK